MIAAGALARLERIVDASAVAPRIEALLPVGARRRQLSVRTLLLGMLLVAADGRPAHLRRVHRALTELPTPDKRRLGIVAACKRGEHPLTYRQVERTFALVVAALAKDTPDGAPSRALAEVLEALLEAGVKACGAATASSLAVDWTDLEAWARRPGRDGTCADGEASFGHRRGAGGERGETFFGYYLQVATIVKDERGPEAPELVRRIQLTSCDVDPPPALVPVIERMAADGISIGDVLADSGYAYRRPETWALPLRRLGARLIHDLHPNDRGPRGTHMGAILANGNPYCPATPGALLELGPLAPGATKDEQAAHDHKTDELAKYKLSPITGHDRDGYHRVACPATRGKLRCPLRPASMTLPHSRPQVLAPPAQPPACCRQQTLTVPPSVNAKTAQKHDYPSQAHRRSYARRSAAERAYATIKDPATNDLSRGWCRLTALTPIALFAATVVIARNLRVADSFAARRAEDERRAARGLAPKRRRRRRHTAADLISAANAPP
jgi:hypothetical protein